MSSYYNEIAPVGKNILHFAEVSSSYEMSFGKKHGCGPPLFLFHMRQASKSGQVKQRN